ncbi:MAG TPA: hypothetical protein DCZ95_00010 [Verrucomicrobia bacterium]|nr:MAG: hypothetical protein A2X46_17270 [Lentisphaerae bacterium GWF2_57_35]HBA82453.1 hypothetical protein [Verrucomicrobiota bacterium]
MKKRLLTWLGCAAVLAVVAAAPVRAEFVQQNFQITTQSFNINYSFDVNQFDAALGTLTGMQVRLVSLLTTDLGIENTTVGASNYISAYLPSDWTVRRTSDNYLFTDCSPTVSVVSVGLPPYDGNTDYQPPSGQTFLGLTNSAGGLFFSSNAGLLTDFTGVGAVSLRLDAQLGALDVVGESGKTESGITANEMGSALIEVSYWYNAIPEPATALLLLMGVIGLGGRRFLKKG